MCIRDRTVVVWKMLALILCRGGARVDPLVTIAVSHLEVLHLGDHVEAFTITQVEELPFFKSTLFSLLMLLFDKFNQLHWSGTDLDSVLNRTLKLGRDRHIDRHLIHGTCSSLCLIIVIGACRRLLGAHRGLKKQLIGRLLFLAFASAWGLILATFTGWWCEHVIADERLCSCEIGRLVLLILRLIQTCLWLRVLFSRWVALRYWWTSCRLRYEHSWPADVSPTMRVGARSWTSDYVEDLSLIHISEPTRPY